MSQVFPKKIVLFFFLLIFSPIAFSQKTEEKIPDVTVKTGVTLLQFGEKEKRQHFLAVNFENFPGWHTYWINPGDAGLPTKVKFNQDGKDIPLEEATLPTPSKFIEPGDMWAYGYKDAYTYFFKIKPDQMEALKNSFNLKATWLVCKHLCIPGKWEAQVKIDSDRAIIEKSEPKIDLINLGSQEVQGRFLELPKLAPWPAELDLNLYQGEKEKELYLFFTLTHGLQKKPFEGQALFIPFPAQPFNFGHEELFAGKGEELYGRTRIEWDGEYQDPPLPLSKDGKFGKAFLLKFIYFPPSGEAPVILEKSFDHFIQNDQGQFKEMNSLYGILSPIKTSSHEQQADSAEVASQTAVIDDAKEPSLFLALLLAILGGFILNFMPCVLPVISIKLFGLLKHRDDNPGMLWRHNLAYTLGILASFLLLGALAALLKVTGQSVGWGLQLQSPRFVAIMVIVLFVLTLNLFGLFEFRVPGGKILGNVSLKEGFIGDFFSGVLATILSTPCSAPFLGSAVAFAFTKGPLEIILIFLAVGVGLSLPFQVTSFFPGVMKILPKPGAWMESLKKFLGLSLILTMIWLIDVFQALTAGTVPSIKLNSILAFVFFGFYFQKNISAKFLWRALIFVFPLLLFTNLMLAPNPSKAFSTSGSNLLLEKNAHGLNWVNWSEEEMKKAQERGETVFIDFTAKWCFTCKVNEKLVLETEAFKSLVAEKKLGLLLGDWTQRDEVIGKWLLDHGAPGVPAYFIQYPDGSLKFLGETLSINKIESNLNH